tara:strand:- start:185 stop:787 length:603 start_codon:yes stop_codon:yes gene_type:complete
MENPKITTTFEQGGALKELFKALIRAQGNMEPVLKDKKNAHFGNAYADINSILETVLPSLRAEGVLLTQHIGWSDGGQVATVTTVLAHEDGGWMKSTAGCSVGSKVDPQKTMAATTYLRRYGIQAALGLPAVDDDGNRASGRQGPDLRAVLDYVSKVSSITTLAELQRTADAFGEQKPLEQMTRGELNNLVKRIKEELHG